MISKHQTLQDKEIWSEFFRIKNHIMDVHKTFVEAVNNLRSYYDKNQGNTSRARDHRLTATNQMEILYDLCQASNAIPIPAKETKDNKKDEERLLLLQQHKDIQRILLMNRFLIEIQYLIYAKKIFTNWFMTTGFFNITISKMEEIEDYIGYTYNADTDEIE